MNWKECFTQVLTIPFHLDKIVQIHHHLLHRIFNPLRVSSLYLVPLNPRWCSYCLITLEGQKSFQKYFISVPSVQFDESILIDQILFTFLILKHFHSVQIKSLFLLVYFNSNFKTQRRNLLELLKLRSFAVQIKLANNNNWFAERKQQNWSIKTS